jgi:hypothetical protein
MEGWTALISEEYLGIMFEGEGQGEGETRRQES